MHKPEEISLSHLRHGEELLRDIDEDTVSELALSIRSNGLLQPILVRPVDKCYEVVFGHHRLEACKRLGWNSIRAQVKEMSAEESFITGLGENIQRNNEINPLTEARGYIKLVERGWTINKIASRIGKSDSYVSDRIGLIRRLHPEIVRRVKSNHGQYLKPSHLELLARIRSKRYQIELSGLVERKRLSVRKLERMISGGAVFKETLEERNGSLYLKLPEDIVEHMRFEEGDEVYIFPQSKRRIAIENAIIQKLESTKKVSTPPQKSFVTPVPV